MVHIYYGYLLASSDILSVKIAFLKIKQFYLSSSSQNFHGKDSGTNIWGLTNCYSKFLHIYIGSVLAFVENH